MILVLNLNSLMKHASYRGRLSEQVTEGHALLGPQRTRSRVPACSAPNLAAGIPHSIEANSVRSASYLGGDDQRTTRRAPDSA